MKARNSCGSYKYIPWLVFLLGLGGFALSGCDGESGPALSLQPFYLQPDLETDATLIGTWTSEDGEVSFRFDEGQAKAYKLQVRETESGRTSSAEFEVHLVRLGSVSFLDFFPKGGNSGSTFYALHLLPAHSIARVELSSDSIQLAFLDGGWLKKSLDAQTVDVATQKTNGTMLLTGETREVQKLVDFHSNDTDAFPDAVTLFREESEP